MLDVTRITIHYTDLFGFGVLRGGVGGGLNLVINDEEAGREC